MRDSVEKLVRELVATQDNSECPGPVALLCFTAAMALTKLEDEIEELKGKIR